MKKALLTGATGFVGRAALTALHRRGFDVHAVDVQAVESPPPGVTWHRADLHDLPSVLSLVERVRPTHLLHLAWAPIQADYLSTVENLRWVVTSLGVLDAFARSGGQRVVMAGTCFEYDARFGYCSETLTPRAPASLYGAAKQALGALLAPAAAAYGVSAAWARLFFLYGPHEHPKRLVASVVRSLMAGQPARCSHGRQLRDFLHVGDAGDGLAALLESTIAGPINVASGQPVALRDIIFHIADRFSARDLIDLGAVSTPPDEPPLIVADVGRLSRELGWSPSHTLTTGLDDTIGWWRQHG